MVAPRVNTFVRILQRSERALSDNHIANPCNLVSSEQEALERFHFFLLKYVCVVHNSLGNVLIVERDIYPSGPRSSAAIR